LWVLLVEPSFYRQRQVGQQVLGLHAQRSIRPAREAEVDGRIADLRERIARMIVDGAVA
jgi:hypothetical protein